MGERGNVSSTGPVVHPAFYIRVSIKTVFLVLTNHQHRVVPVPLITALSR